MHGFSATMRALRMNFCRTSWLSASSAPRPVRHSAAAECFSTFCSSSGGLFAVRQIEILHFTSSSSACRRVTQVCCKFAQHAVSSARVGAEPRSASVCRYCCRSRRLHYSCIARTFAARECSAAASRVCRLAPLIAGFRLDCISPHYDQGSHPGKSMHFRRSWPAVACPCSGFSVLRGDPIAASLWPRCRRC